MVEEKSWYESKSVWGALIAVAASIAASFGIVVDATGQADLTEAIIQLVGAIGAMLALYGRLSATRVIA